MSNQQNPSSSTQVSSSNTPASDRTYKRTGKVTSDGLQYYGVKDDMPPPYILIEPSDKKGPLRDEEGRKTTQDFFYVETRTESPLRVENKILDKAIEVNKKKMAARGEEIDEKHPEPYLFHVGDTISLEYTEDRLTAIEKTT